MIGVEPSRYLCELGRTHYGLDLRAGILSDHNFDPETFDVICLWDVLEHLTNPDAIVAEIHSLLRPGGHFIVSYPDYGSWAQRILGKKWPFLLSVHLTYFTKPTIRQFLGDRGFDVKSIGPLWQTLEFGYVLKRASDYFRLFEVARRIVGWIGCSRLPLTYNMGQSIAVAQKK